MAASPTPKFNQLSGWIHNNPHPQGFVATYPTGPFAANPRTLFPVAVGYRETNLPTPQDADERVLCWQVANGGDPGGWRCFKVINLTITGPSGAPWPNPPHFNPNHPNQGCVQDVKHHP
jgi:hypothetical protein